jgi:hypothetical protein
VSFSTDPRLPRDGYPSDEVATRRVLMLFAISLIVVGLLGLVAVTIVRNNRSDSPAKAAPTSPAGGVAVGGLGPQPGDDLASYTSGRTAALAAATGQRVAVVSFTKYVNDAQARAVAGPVQVTAVLAAVPGGTPALVTGPFADWVNAQTADQRSEREEIQKLLPTVDDPQFKAFYNDEVARLGKLIDSVTPDAPLVFGVVVRGQAAALQGLARSPDVRLVDVAPSAAVKAGTPERGIRPEETAKANDPAVRPV